MIIDLQHQIKHLEAVNSKLVPDLEAYEAQIYELREKVSELELELKEKDRESYNMQKQLNEAKTQLIVQEQVIQNAGAQ